MEKRPPNPTRRLPLVLALCGALGATGTIFGLGGLAAWNEPLPELPALQLPPAPPGDEAAWARVEEAWQHLPSLQLDVLRARRPALNALAAVNFVSSLALLYGTLAARLRRPRGLASLRSGLVLSQAYAALATAVQTWVQVGVLTAQRPVLLPLLQEGGTVRSVALLALVAQVGAVALTGAAMVAQLIFYVWAARYFRRESVQKALAPIE